jgi:imidazole glycerol-phosphate synthase subunit HisF
MGLKRRVIPVLLYKGGNLVKGRKFNHARVVGHVRQAVRIYQGRGVDELIVLDIAATNDGREPDWILISDLTGECFMPIAIGGGIRTLEHFRMALRNGADKIVINTAAIETPELIEEASKTFGSQAVVVSIDVLDGQVFSHSGTVGAGLDPVAWAKDAANRGAGELVINSIERDGTLTGYDLGLIRSVSDAVSIPVVACGGAGEFKHFVEAFEAGAHAVAAGAIWQFTEVIPIEASRYLQANGIPTRLT